MFYHMFVPTIRPHDHHPGPDDGHNSPPFRQQHSSSAPATSTHARETPQPSYKRARYAGDELEEFSGGQSHHLSLQNLSARSHDAAQTFDSGRADPPTEPRPAHNTWPMQNVKKPPGRGKKHCGSGGQNHHVQGQLSELPRMLPQLRERSRNFGNVPEVSPRALRDFPMDATDPPRFREVRPWGNFGNLAFFACMRQRTPVGFMGLINFDTPSLVGGA